jgi:hypothetical protein
MELSKEEINFIIDSLSYTADKSVQITNSFNNEVYNKATVLIERFKIFYKTL